MSARDIFNPPGDFKAKPAIKLGRLEIMCFQDDLHTPALPRRSFHSPHQFRAVGSVSV